jgi:cell division transport system permease protein
MLIVNLKRTFRSGFISFWRSALVSLASVITITVTLFVVGALWLSSAYLNSSLEAVKNKVDISVAMKPDVAELEVLDLQKKLERLPEVKTVVYSSREQELADFQKRNEDNDLIIQSLKEVGNPFGARLNIQAVDPSRYESVAKFLESDSVSTSAGGTIVDQISFKKNIVDKLIKIITTAKTIGWAIVLVLIFLSVVVTFNTVSLAIYVSREEISLMKLVGAGNNYIRGPFVVEGLISGAMATVLALALLYPACIWVRNTTAGVFGGIDLVNYFLGNIIQILLLLFAVGIFLGVVSSFLAVRKHLRK